MRRLLLTLITDRAVLGFAAPASATPPERFRFSESSSEPGFIQCDGFAINETSPNTDNGTILYDRTGQVVKVLRRGRIRETFTNSVTGKILVNQGRVQGPLPASTAPMTSGTWSSASTSIRRCRASVLYWRTSEGRCTRLTAGTSRPPRRYSAEFRPGKGGQPWLLEMGSVATSLPLIRRSGTCSGVRS